jgi:hypothetical protein
MEDTRWTHGGHTAITQRTRRTHGRPLADTLQSHSGHMTDTW